VFLCRLMTKRLDDVAGKVHHRGACGNRYNNYASGPENLGRYQQSGSLPVLSMEMPGTTEDAWVAKG
jgi:hypothetical protein